MTEHQGKDGRGEEWGTVLRREECGTVLRRLWRWMFHIRIHGYVDGWIHRIHGYVDGYIGYIDRVHR
jgi:hypothetical protein